MGASLEPAVSCAGVGCEAGQHVCDFVVCYLTDQYSCGEFKPYEVRMIPLVRLI